jgi:hypothetical protein
MTSIRKTRTGSVLALTLALAGLTACGHNTAPPIGAASPRPPVTQPATTAPAEQPSTTPTTPKPPATTAPAGTVLSSRVSYPWHWPNDVNLPGEIGHTHHVPPVPELIAISAGEHPSDPGEQSYNRLSFTFTAAFPSYQFRFVNALVTDPGGRTVRLGGNGVLRVTFRQAQAHRSDGTSSVISQPPRHLGYTRMVSWAPAGDFEGVLTYGIGIASSASDSNPQFTVRAIEVEKVNAQGQHLYIVAIDIGAPAR